MRISDWSSDVCSSDLRLSAITDAIAHPDVRAHYVHAFRERYDALFFARAAFQPRHQRGGSGARSGWQRDRRGNWKPPLPPAGSEARAIGASGMEQRLLRAVPASLLRPPEQIELHPQMLPGPRLADPVLAELPNAVNPASHRTAACR